MQILLVNDDGFEAPGLKLLAEKLAERHTVTVAAPAGNRSAVGHGLTMRQSLFAEEKPLTEGVRAYSISGTPADCTRLGLGNLTEDPVDLVISGPNVGLNIAFDVFYSGTVSAALEAAMYGKKAIAVSAPPHADMGEVVRVFLRLLEQLDPQRHIRHLLNINIPALPLEEIKGVKWVPQGSFFQWDDKYETGEDGGYQIRGTELPAPERETDSSAVREGFVALTPLSFQLTDREGFFEKEFAL